jgi:CheY-like chemotaxis protein
MTAPALRATTDTNLRESAEPNDRQDHLPMENTLYGNLTLDSMSTPSPTTRRAIATTEGEGIKILVVDDEPEIVKAVSMRLRFAGYEIVTAMDGAQATQVAFRENPDLVILDIGMPCGDGHTVAKRLADNTVTMMTPIIFLTARTAPVEKERAISEGAAGFLTKPFIPSELLAAVHGALSGQTHGLN